jgi:hypothetical protein
MPQSPSGLQHMDGTTLGLVYACLSLIFCLAWIPEGSLLGRWPGEAPRDGEK